MYTQVIATIYKTGTAFECHSKDCMYSRDCANHYTAGDFRSEDGLYPILKLWPDKKWYCNQKFDESRQGAAFINERGWMTEGFD